MLCVGSMGVLELAGYFRLTLMALLIKELCFILASLIEVFSKVIIMIIAPHFEVCGAC